MSVEGLADEISVQAEALRRAADRLDELGAAVPAPDPGPGADGTGTPLAGGVRVGGDVPEMLEEWIASSTGDLRWLRPDQYLLPGAPRIAAAVARAIASGRRSRAIYPARALEESPDVIFAAADAGEEVRILASVPSRMAIIGDDVVLLPEHWGEFNDRRLVVHQDGLRAALMFLFDQLWDRAIVIPGLGSDSGPNRPGRGDRRALLLEQLADGARDEQIARTLGTSLRTVRRHVAALLEELHVDSRFQAGVEAVRRGWL